MESSLPIFSAITSPSTSHLSFFAQRRLLLSKRPLLFPISSKNKEDEPDFHTDAENTQLLGPFSSLSNDSAMGLVLSAATGRGWTTGSGMEGPASPKSDPDPGGPTGLAVSTFPWSLFTRSPRRRMRVAFTCNVCGQRTTRAINPHAYTDGTVFVQCCGCNVFHKLVDNLNLFHEMKCYVNPSFRYKGDMSFDFFDGDADDDDDDDDGSMFPII